MFAEKILEVLSHSGRYSARIEDEVVRVENLHNGSEYIIEEFSASYQVRQAILFDCQGAESLEVAELYILCSRINERFSGCKCFIDEWDVLVNAFDIIAAADPAQLIETVLDQIEFVSQVLLELLNVMRTSNRLPSFEEIETAFQVPPLQ